MSAALQARRAGTETECIKSGAGHDNLGMSSQANQEVQPDQQQSSEEDLSWTVVHYAPVKVRQENNPQANVLGVKERGAVVRGKEEDGWLRLLDEPGFLCLRADFSPYLLKTSEAGQQYKRVPVMDIFDQLEKELEGARTENASKPIGKKPSPLHVPSARAAVAAMTSGGGEQMTVSFAEEQADERSLPETTKEWLRNARGWLRRLDRRATVPPTSQLPRVALNWEPAAAVLYVLTNGHFDPQRDVPELDMQSKPGLVSVCCSTSDRRRSFHPLLYNNFQKQTHANRELIVVHTGEMPSEFFTEKAKEDPRVVYRFFPVTREAPGSPRLTDEQVGNPWDSIVLDDDPTEITQWGTNSPWKHEIHREGWTKGLKRNVACCIARGQVIAHFDDGCIYAPDYIGRMMSELSRQGSAGPAAVCPSKWYTLDIAETEFRLVDMKKAEPLWECYGSSPKEGQEADQFNHGFNYIYTRSAWVQQPFPDVETTGSRDGDFIKGLKSNGGSVKLVDATADTFTACGWHRDATCGSKDVPANVNYSQVINFLMFRGTESKAPGVLQDFVPMVKEIASDFRTRRDRYLKDLTEEHGSLLACSFCNFALALTKNSKGSVKRMLTCMPATDSHEMTVSLEKQDMKFDVLEVSKAGGAVAEGPLAQQPDGNPWIGDSSTRMAICRNCGFQLGWRFEKGTPGSGKTPSGPVSWAFISRHLRERTKPGERIPDDSQHSRHKETVRNKGRSTVCPEGHMLRCFSTGQGNGGALPMYYICDVCDKPARGAQHMWGCGICDYDMCEPCRAKRI